MWKFQYRLTPQGLYSCPISVHGWKWAWVAVWSNNVRVLGTALYKHSWNVIAHGDEREGKWRGNWWMEWVASTLHTTSQHGVTSITTADAHTSAAGSQLNWRHRRFKWTGPFRRKTKSGFCACAITFQTHSTTGKGRGIDFVHDTEWGKAQCGKKSEMKNLWSCRKLNPGPPARNLAAVPTDRQC